MRVQRRSLAKESRDGNKKDGPTKSVRRSIGKERSPVHNQKSTRMCSPAITMPGDSRQFSGTTVASHATTRSAFDEKRLSGDERNTASASVRSALYPRAKTCPSEQSNIGHTGGLK